MGRILILEDEESVNRGISFSLEKAGHEVCACHTVRAAREQAVLFLPDLVLCDISLPDGNGLEFITWLRQQLDVYVICLTALDQELDQVMGYEAGADDYITKPFSLSVLLLKIEAFFRRKNKQEQESSILHSGALVINPNEMKLYAAEAEVSLTKTEWKLLLLFLNHAGQILSKTQILSNVFDVDGDFVDENTLAVNIRRLREKIEENPANPVYVKNIRGLGYVWDVEVRPYGQENGE